MRSPPAPTRLTATPGSAFSPDAASWWRTASPWRPTGASASTRRSGGWVDRRARELIYHEACRATCPPLPPRDDDRRPIAGALVRRRPVADRGARATALRDPASRRDRRRGARAPARGPQDHAHVLAVAGARGHARLGRAARAALRGRPAPGGSVDRRPRAPRGGRSAAPERWGPRGVRDSRRRAPAGG